MKADIIEATRMRILVDRAPSLERDGLRKRPGTVLVLDGAVMLTPAFAKLKFTM